MKKFALQIFNLNFCFFLAGCTATSSNAPGINSADSAFRCAENTATVDSVSNAFRYSDLSGKDFYWVGDDDEAGLNPVRLKLGEDCVLRANPGYDDFGSNPSITAQWRYTAEGAVKIVNWSDQFSLLQTTSVSHEICWASFSTCEGEGKFRSEGGVRRLFFTRQAAEAYFDAL